MIDDPSSILAAGAGTTTGFADRTINTAQAHIKQVPEDFKAYAQLGFAFQQKARETNDPTFYTQAEDALSKALAIKPDYYDALGGLGQLNLSRHEFVTALDWGRKAQALQPASAYAYGVIGDAQIELGQYDNAVQTFQKMVDLAPRPRFIFPCLLRPRALRRYTGRDPGHAAGRGCRQLLSREHRLVPRAAWQPLFQQ